MVVTASVAAMVAAMVAMVVTAVAAVTAVPRLCEHHRPGTLHHHAERVVGGVVEQASWEDLEGAVARTIPTVYLEAMQ